MKFKTTEILSIAFLFLCLFIAAESGFFLIPLIIFTYYLIKLICEIIGKEINMFEDKIKDKIKNKIKKFKNTFKELSNKICLDCNTILPIESTYCKNCGSNSIKNIASLKNEQEKKRKKIKQEKLLLKLESYQKEALLKEKKLLEAKNKIGAQKRYSFLKIALLCNQCDIIYDPTYKFCVKCKAETVPISQDKIFTTMKSEFPSLINKEEDLNNL